MGGHVFNPTYKQVCTGTTGHAEVVQVTFDPARISYEKLLESFWKLHDPTTPDQQGGDVGPQYRSVIFFHGEAQRDAADTGHQQEPDRDCDQQFDQGPALLTQHLVGHVAAHGNTRVR